MRSSLISKNFPSLVIGAITTAAFRRTVVQVRAFAEDGERTCSVTTSKCEFAKFVSVETVSHPSLSWTSLLCLTGQRYPRSCFRQRLICAFTFSGEGAPTARRAESERRTSKTFSTSDSNRVENFRNAARGISSRGFFFPIE